MFKFINKSRLNILFHPAYSAGHEYSLFRVKSVNEIRYFRMFISMTRYAKNFYISGVKGFGNIFASVNNMMSLKFIGASTFLTFSNFLFKHVNKQQFFFRPITVFGIFSNRFWFKFPSDIFAFFRAISCLFTAALSTSKGLIALVTYKLYECLKLFSFANMHTYTRTKQSCTRSFSPRARNRKFFIANTAYFNDFTPVGIFSKVFSHV